MKNKTRVYLFGVAVFAITFCPFFASASVSSAVSYLEAQDQNAWITQALVAAGGANIETSYLASVSEGMNPTNDYAKAILALTAAQENPTTFGQEDYVAKLKTYYNNNQMGDAGLLNDDIWSILALASVYEINSPEAIASKNYLLSNQNDDGGWSYSISGGSDTNDTASAIIALVEAGISTSDEAIVNALAYLQLAQNDDGGFPYDPSSAWGTDSDSGSDAWVITALNKVGINPVSWDKNGNNPISHLESLQDEADGGFWWVLPGTSEWNNKAMTAFAVIALADKTFPVAYFNVPEPVVTHDVHLVIKGETGIICDTNIEADTALNTVVKAASSCDFTYNIQDTDFGPYLNQINDDASVGMIGWLYYVNTVSPMVGADQYTLSEGDEVLWYFGEWGWDNTSLEEDGESEVAVTVSLPMSITIPSTVTDATINVSSLSSDDGVNVTATLPEINLSVTTNLSDTPVSVAIPDGTIITAPTGWNGIINAPRIEANSSVTVDVDSGFSADISSVIEVGYGDTEILFSKAVRLLIPGAAGKEVGYSRGDNFTKITTSCDADLQEAGDALSAGGECKIDVGADLVVWTKHFTKFTTYTQTAIQTPSGGSFAPTATNYCQEIEYDEWRVSCVDGWQYRDVLSRTSPGCSLTLEQEDLRKRQCTTGVEEEEQSVVELILEEIIEVEVLGISESFSVGGEISSSVITSEADIIVTGNINLLIAELGFKRDMALEIGYGKTIISKIVANSDIIDEERYAITNFITYGSATTLNLGAGERAGVINSFKARLGRLPATLDDWNDIINIANASLPEKADLNAEEKAKKLFKDIYLREVDSANINDNLAINMISYGLRPVERSLEKETEGIKVFQSHFGYNPFSAYDWDIVRAVSYGGTT